MPYVPTNPDDEDQKKNISGTDDAGLGGTGGQNMPSPQQSGLSGWTDVKAYLDANKDQALGMAKNLGDKLGGEADTIRGTIDTGEKDFENQVNAGKVDYDPTLVDSALANPTEFVKDNANVDKFGRLRDANYTGPNDLTTAGKAGELQAKIKEGQARANTIDTEGGRQSLLFEGPGNPTKGQVTLDSLLIAGSPESRDVLKAGAGKFSTLDSYLDEQSKKGADYAKGAKATTAETGAKTKAALDTAIPGFQSDVDSRLAAARQTARTRAENAEGVLIDTQNQGAGKRDAQALKDLGLTDAELNKMATNRSVLNQYKSLIDPTTGKPYFSGNFDPKAFLTEKNPENEITRSNFASADDYAKAAALAKLSGQDMSGFLNPNDATKAGTADLDIVDYSPDGMGSLNGIVTDRDKYLIGQIMGTQTPEDPNSWSGGVGYWNNIYSGRLQPNPNPDMAARDLAALSAAIRQGWFKPTDEAERYKRDHNVLGFGGTPGVY